MDKKVVSNQLDFNNELGLFVRELTWKRGPLIGKGAYGSVYLARRTLDSTDYFSPKFMAIKSARYSASMTLQREKQILLDLRGSPYIISCYGDEVTSTNNHQNVIYNLKLEYAAAGTLDDLINQFSGKGMPESYVVGYTRIILKGIQHIHENGYVHCDLKPENVLLKPTLFLDVFALVIGDFGLAKKRSKEVKPSPTFRGTPHYMAPESVMFGIQEASSDIWALGCIVFEMLTGRKMWPGLTRDEVLKNIRESRGLVEIPANVSEEAKCFLRLCFERDPSVRTTAGKLSNHPFLWRDILAAQRRNSIVLKDEDVKFCKDESNTFMELKV